MPDDRIPNDRARNDKLLSTKSAASSSDDETESRMRLALGLRGPAGAAGHAPQQRADQARARHKFVQDGGVPVVMLNRGGDQDAASAARARIGEIEHQLDAERAQHGATRRQLSEAQSTIQSLQTRLAHAELAHHDALAAASRALDAAQANAAQVQAEQALAIKVEPAKAAAPRATAYQSRQPRKPAIDRTLKEEKPVRWWTPSYKAKTR